MPENKDELDLFSRSDFGGGSDVEAIKPPEEAAEIDPAPEETIPAEEVEPQVQEEVVEELPPELSDAQEVVAPVSEAVAEKNPLPMPEIETLEDFGNYLRRVRKAENLSIKNVAAETRIREHYIEALEEGNGAELPPGVFVLAYARKLCRLYGIEIDQMDNVVELLRNKVAYELPSDLSKVVGGGEIDEAELRRRNRLAIAFVSLLALIVLAVISGVVLLVVFFGGKSDAQLTESDIIKLQGQPALNYDRLQAPAGKTGQKR